MRRFETDQFTVIEGYKVEEVEGAPFGPRRFHFDVGALLPHSRRDIAPGLC
jgi:hypothetical protein